MKLRVLGAVCAALTLTLVGCSEKANTSDGGVKDKGGVKTGEGVTDSVISSVPSPT